MSWYDKGFLAAYFLVIILAQAIWQHQRFKRNKPINHAWHTIYYLVATLPAMYIFGPWWLKVLAIALAARLALFDPVLNFVRGKRPLLTYNGNGTTGSKIDQWENRFSVTWLTVLKVGYIILFVVVLILIK